MKFNGLPAVPKGRGGLQGDEEEQEEESLDGLDREQQRVGIAEWGPRLRQGLRHVGESAPEIGLADRGEGGLRGAVQGAARGRRRSGKAASSFFAGKEGSGDHRRLR